VKPEPEPIKPIHGKHRRRYPTNIRSAIDLQSMHDEMLVPSEDPRVE
jgi:hypothetical protein